MECAWFRSLLSQIALSPNNAIHIQLFASNRVVYCTSRHDPSQVYAMKIMDKVHIKKENKVGEIAPTVRILECLKSNLLSKYYDPNNSFNIQSSEWFNVIFAACTCYYERSRMLCSRDSCLQSYPVRTSSSKCDCWVTSFLFFNSTTTLKKSEMY